MKFPRPVPIEWVCLVLGLFLTLHYAWLADDAYIYFRYIDNLLFLRAGLVFNRGEFVEGFSSPVWALLLIILRAFHAGYFTITRFFAILTFPIFWALLVIINRKLSEGNDTTLIVNFPLIHLSLSYGVLSYFTSGLETPLVQISGVAYAAFLFFPNSFWLQFAVGLSPFVRHDLLLPCVIAILWFVWQKKRIPITSVVTFLSVGVALAVFRIYYYAELLPNTFYLKDLMWISQGLVYVKDTLLAYRLNYIFPFFFLCFCGLWFFAKASATLHISQRLMMLIFGLTVTAYVVKIGGDPRHYRYLAFPYCVIMCSTGGLIEHLLGRLRIRVPTLQVFLLGSAVASFTIIQYPRQLSRHPIFYENQHLEVEKINDAVFQRLFEVINPSCAWGADADKPLLKKMIMFNQRFGSSYYRGVRSHGLCVAMWRDFSSQYVHTYGLTEPFLARTEMKSDRPAHKEGLRPLANDILQIRTRYGFMRGAFRKAIEAGTAPEWVKNNLTSIENVELKAYNRHLFLENFRLAFQRTGKIMP